MINLYHGDCMDYMREMPDKCFDLAIVDPWYGIGLTPADIVPEQNYFDELFRVSKHQLIWGGNYFDLPKTNAWLCWFKRPF